MPTPKKKAARKAKRKAAPKATRKATRKAAGKPSKRTEQGQASTDGKPKKRSKRSMSTALRARIRELRAEADAIETKPGAGGRPEFKPTKAQRHEVQVCSGWRMKQEQICALILNPSTDKPIGLKTLRKVFAHELIAGPALADRSVVKGLFETAASTRTGQVTAAVYLTKAVMGWRETQHVEIESKSGVLVLPSAANPDEWIAAATKRAAELTEPGKAEDKK